MASEVFVDAGAWIALSDARDRHHWSAMAYHQRLLHDRRMLVTTNLVIAEAYVLIRRRGGHQAAMRFLRALNRSNVVQKVYSDAQVDAEAEEILRRYDDQAFSYADAVSFAVMRARGIDHAFAFDRHFQSAGFTLVPDPAS